MRVFFVFVVLFVLGCVGDDPRRVKRIQKIKSLQDKKADLVQKKKQLQSIVNGEETQTIATILDGDLFNAMKAELPIRFPASRLSSYLNGEVVIDRVKVVEFENNSIQIDVLGHGDYILVKFKDLIPRQYRTMATEIIEGIVGK